MDPVWKFEHSVQCNANQSFAWSFWTDIANWKRIEGNAVEHFKLEGRFANGTKGVTKMPGQPPVTWELTAVEPERTATIKMPLGGAIFYNTMEFTPLASNQTLITQTMSLVGEKAAELAPGMAVFETTAPQGLIKLAQAIGDQFKD